VSFANRLSETESDNLFVNLQPTYESEVLLIRIAHYPYSNRPIFRKTNDGPETYNLRGQKRADDSITDTLTSQLLKLLLYN
jgi:hypothetical protein